MTAHDARGELVAHDALERRPGSRTGRCASSRHLRALAHVQERLEEACQPRRPVRLPGHSLIHAHGKGERVEALMHEI